MNYELKFLGEIRFGPEYFQLYINGVKVDNFAYGDCFAELNSGRYLAIQEWLTTSTELGPVTRVAIFDLKYNVVAKLESVKSGFVRNFKLEGNSFSYTEERHLSQVTENLVEWDSIKNWQPINP